MRPYVQAAVLKAADALGFQMEYELYRSAGGLKRNASTQTEEQPVEVAEQERGNHTEL